MKEDFWLERWKRSEIGFHQSEINPYLRQYWQELHLARGSKVLVPLCGKSLDMRWLRQQGHRVLGVELSPIAAQAFFAENSLTPQHISSGKFERYEADGICILCGDFFDLSRDDLAKVGAVYDRAALIALSPDMRARYARHLTSILPPATRILLVTLDYLQHEIPGPPFAVSAREVEALYHEDAEIFPLAQMDVLAQNPRFRERGLSQLQESIYLLTLRKPAG